MIQISEQISDLLPPIRSIVTKCDNQLGVSPYAVLQKWKAGSGVNPVIDSQLIGSFGQLMEVGNAEG